MSVKELRSCTLGLYVLHWLSVHEDALTGPLLVTGDPERITLSALDGWQRTFDNRLLAALG